MAERKRAYNLKDVAQLAGVSLGTASKVINNLYVKPELRLRVEGAIKELNYVPNTIARSLKANNTKTIGVIIPDVSKAIIGKFLKGVEDVGRKAGYSIIFYDTTLSPYWESEALQIYIEKKVSGILYSSNTVSDEFADKVLASGIPLVLIMTQYQARGISSVVIDNEKAAFEAVDYLCACGHRDIMMLAGHKQDENSGIPRLAGYRKALKKHGISFRPELVTYGGYGMERGYRDMIAFVEQGLPFSAVFAVADDVAVGALKALASKKIAVPEQVSVMGFDGLDISNYTIPSLSTVAQPFYQMGEEAAKILIGKIEDGRADTHLVLGHELVKRESVRIRP